MVIFVSTQAIIFPRISPAAVANVVLTVGAWLLEG
jgi:hypothetical protein